MLRDGGVVVNPLTTGATSLVHNHEVLRTWVRAWGKIGGVVGEVRRVVAKEQSYRHFPCFSFLWYILYCLFLTSTFFFPHEAMLVLERHEGKKFHVFVCFVVVRTDVFFLLLQD